jgi:hypothetical protein
MLAHFGGVHIVHVVLVFAGPHVVVAGGHSVVHRVVLVQIKPGQVLGIGSAISAHGLRVPANRAGLEGVQHFLRQAARLERALEQSGLAAPVMVLHAVVNDLERHALAGLDVAAQGLSQDGGRRGLKVGPPLIGNLSLPLFAQP